jgi:nucleoside-diphosphate-sugar epimerase
MKFLLTGSTGFLGSTIVKALAEKEVYTLGRQKCSISVDLRYLPRELVLPKVDFVIHIAGKAHVVPKTLSEENDFFETNVVGTKNLLANLENGRLPKAFVFISSVAVYGLATGNDISENSDLLAKDPYGRSKIEVEAMIIEWAQKHAVKFLILRLPLIAGMNPPGNLGSMINGIKKGFYFNIGRGDAKKSVVMASDIGLLIKNLSENIQNGIYNLTDGYHPSFLELSIHLSKQLGKSNPFKLPYFLAKILALIGDIIGPRFPINSIKLNKITSNLTFNDSKARCELGWRPSFVLEDFKIIESNQ